MESISKEQNLEETQVFAHTHQCPNAFKIQHKLKTNLGTYKQKQSGTIGSECEQHTQWQFVEAIYRTRMSLEKATQRCSKQMEQQQC